MGRLQDEMLALLFLNEGGCFLRCVVHPGGFDSACADYRSILGEALACDGHRLVLAHNHPSGAVTPSRTDRESTLALMALGRPLRIDIEDHLVITRDTAFSMRQAGLLDANR